MAARAATAAANPDLSPREVSWLAASRLIRESATFAGAVGGITSAPATLPIIGTVATAVMSSTADLACLVRLQIELCYRIAFVYESRIDAEELQAVVLAIVGFSSSGELAKGIAGDALRSAVDELSRKFLVSGLEAAATDVARRTTSRILGRAFRLLPLLGIPIGASVNISSTLLVGGRARSYFVACDPRP